MSKDEFTLKELMIENRSDVKNIVALTGRMEEHLRTLNGRVGKLEGQVSVLESYKWRLIGGITVLSILTPLVIDALKRLIL